MSSVIPMTWIQLASLQNQSGLATFQSPWVDATKWRVVAFEIDWTAVAATAGTLAIEGSLDYRIPDSGPFVPSALKIVPMTITTSHGTWPTVGVSAANAMVILENTPPLVRVTYTRSAGGAVNQFNVQVFGRAL